MKKKLTLQCESCVRDMQCTYCKGSGVRVALDRTISTVVCDYCQGRGKQYCYHCRNNGFWTRSEGMYVCVGGPLNGEFVCRSELPKDEYEGFNASTTGHRWRKNKDDGESLIWVHKSLLP